MTDHPNLRDQIINYLKRELVGPDPIAPNIQPNGEEILLNDGPTLRYGAGVLFPQLTVNIESDREDDPDVPEPSEPPIIEDGDELPERISEGNLSLEEDSVTEEPISLANAFKPAAMGISFLAEIGKSDLIVNVSAAVYKKETFTTDERKMDRYLRQPFRIPITISKDDLLSESTFLKEFILPGEAEKPLGLKLVLVSRPEPKSESGNSRRLLTISLVNINVSDTSQVRKDLCFFQVGFTVRSSDESHCFIEYPEKKEESLDDEELSMRLLYRHRKTFAVGHGCAADWTEADGKSNEVRTTVIPTYDVKPIIPPKLDGLTLSMYLMSDLDKNSDVLSILEELCEKYEKWITLQHEATSSLPPELVKTAGRHLDDCTACLKRMREGVGTLRGSPRAMRAFRLMNHAMLLQQLRYSMPLREWSQKRGEPESLPLATEPNLDSPPIGKGEWYPFQLAFILINVSCLTNPQSLDRMTADLIWFPTGGGKTEAYLGLTAFTIFARRLIDPKDAGVVVLMRYTLRLLTAQQFQRAASLICACESLRKSNEPELGTDRISIGLWVGGDLTPNKRVDAISDYKKLTSNQVNENPFVVLKCPWCGAQMGRTESGLIKGYEKARTPATIYFVCPDTSCLFSARTYPLPLYVIDEDIYEQRPSLLIGTVDKFAMVTWRPEVRGLFGRDDSGFSPPDLVIQDELHLISGPLGSMVGHYETVIEELSTDFTKSPPRPAKIVASTATIRRAGEQVSALFNRPVFQFPPQALEAGESFFATEDRMAAGRTYVGVHASALSSPVIAQVRTFATLLQAVMSAKVENETERDAYFTLLGYFNSLRELGHAATLVSGEIPEFLKASFWNRRETPNEERRYIRSYQELTSRMESTKITESLQSLERKYPKLENGENPVDICLATNMISVGVDVSRLGLMAVVGQPKSTSEYIQATSRVGRSKNAPGLVVTLLNTSRSRDRSHYEKFRTYHSTLYKQVEPTSVTPWAVPVRKRALHALIVSLVRLLGTAEESRSPNPFPTEELIQRVLKVIRHRVESTDPKEVENVLKEADEFLDDWRRMGPFHYGGFGYKDSPSPLLYPAGTFPLDAWQDRAKQTPSSMRSVDVTCQIGLLKQYPRPDDINSEEASN